MKKRRINIFFIFITVVYNTRLYSSDEEINNRKYLQEVGLSSFCCGLCLGTCCCMTQNPLGVAAGVVCCLAGCAGHKLAQDEIHGIDYSKDFIAQQPR